MFKQSLKLLFVFLIPIMLALMAACVPDEVPVPEPVTDWRDGLELLYPSGQDCKPIVSQVGPIEESIQEVFSFEEGQFFVQNQVIITGLEGDVDKVLKAIAGDEELREILGEEIASISFERLGGKPDESPSPPLRFPPGRVDELTMGLYKTTKPVTETTRAIYGVVTAEIDNLDAVVYAEPNYLTDCPVSALDWDPGGSPYVTVDPHDVASELRYKQWALGESQGINLMDAKDQRKVDESGEGIQVFVLDTSRFDQPGLWEFGGVRWSDDPYGPLELCVSHPEPVRPLSSPESFAPVKDHGIFVASTVHAVAPDSQIHLVKVLNDQGHGTLFWLADALVGVIKARKEANEEANSDSAGYMKGTVINLSLGLNTSDDPNLELTQDQKDRILGKTEELYLDGSEPGLQNAQNAWDMLLAMTNSDEDLVVALETPLAIAYGHGAIIVAAAGNESEESLPESPKPPQIPAAYPTPFVTGVAASNQALGRSCYSNKGDVAAPGGGRDPSQQSSSDCTANVFNNGLNACSAQVNVDCPYGVVSYSPSITTTGYAIWPGTSFAAPQVSGLAALLLERGVPAQEVFDAMRTTTVTDTNLGRGIIDVDQSLP